MTPLNSTQENGMATATYFDEQGNKIEKQITLDEAWAIIKRQSGGGGGKMGGTRDRGIAYGGGSTTPSKFHEDSIVSTGDGHFQCIGQTLKMRLPEAYVSRTHATIVDPVASSDTKITEKSQEVDIMAITRGMCK